MSRRSGHSEEYDADDRDEIELGEPAAFPDSCLVYNCGTDPRLQHHFFQMVRRMETWNRVDAPNHVQFSPHYKSSFCWSCTSQAHSTLR